MATYRAASEFLSRGHRRFAIYEFHGGNIVAIAGENFATIASDTRLSLGFHILSRDQKKLFRLSDVTVLGSCGSWHDVITFTTIIETKMKIYEHEHRKTMSTHAVSQMISSCLYQRKLMMLPFMIFTILAGLDKDGKGVVYSFDPLGHVEKGTFRAHGMTSTLIQPLLDNQIGRNNMEQLPFVPITQERATAIIKDVFVSTAERDIQTGDSVIIYTISKKGITVEDFPLRKD